MKILLIGGLGFIGTRFIRKFHNTHEIIVYITKKNAANTKSNHLKDVTLEYGSVEDNELKKIVEKYEPKAVIHLAALAGLKRCHDDPKLAFSVNVYGTFNVINSCIGIKPKIIFPSSREVYGETIGEKSTEEDELLPNNTYGLTKMISENLIKCASRKFDFDYTILRLTNVYGPEGDKYGAEIIIKDAIRDKKIRILGGTQKLNYVYVDDVVDVMNFALDGAKTSRQTFNVGSNDTVTVEEFAKKVFKSLGVKEEFEYLPMRETETSNFVPDLKKIQSILEDFPKTSLDEGIKKTIKWYSEIKPS